jgi:hypothetical protein
MTEIPGITPIGPDDAPLGQIVAGGIKPMPVTTKPGEWSDTKDYEFHPLSMRFALMEGEEFEDFADDVFRTGQKETVKLYQGKIIDGRNRYRACKARGIPCRFENWNGQGEPADYVISMNLHRRHLTAEARQKLVLKLRKDGKSIRQIAEALQTSVGSVHRDIDQATVPNGTVAGELPSTIKGKDGKTRQARAPKGKATKRSGKTKEAGQGDKGGAAVQQGEGKPAQDKSSEAEKSQNETGQRPRKELRVGPGDLIYAVEQRAGRPTIIQWEVRFVNKSCAGYPREGGDRRVGQ